MPGGEERIRKVRSDKKRAINPTIDLDLYDLLCRIAFVCNRPLKTIGEMLCEKGMKTKLVIEKISPLFRRDFHFQQESDICFRGNPEQSPNRISLGEETKRINLRFRQEVYDQIAMLAYALDLTVSGATTLLLEISVQEKKVFGHVLSATIQDDLSPQRMEQLKVILRQMNQAHLPSSNIPIHTLLGFLFDKMGNRVRKLKDAVEEWLDSSE